MYKQICIYAHAYLCTYIYKYAHTQIHACTCMQTCQNLENMGAYHVESVICLCVSVHVCIYVCLCGVCVCGVCACVYACIYVCVYMSVFL